MSKKERIDHHVRRAFDELDKAREASSPEAALAHLELSELHLGKMKAAADEPRPKLQLVED
jgi:hypothetical protein